MHLILVILVTPVAIWAADRFLLNGDLSTALVATVNEERRRRARARRRPARL
jgi:hypothetical protein